MAKKSMIAREKKRERLVAKYAAKRAELVRSAGVVERVVELDQEGGKPLELDPLD